MFARFSVQWTVFTVCIIKSKNQWKFSKINFNYRWLPKNFTCQQLNKFQMWLLLSLLSLFTFDRDQFKRLPKQHFPVEIASNNKPILILCFIFLLFFLLHAHNEYFRFRQHHTCHTIFTWMLSVSIGWSTYYAYVLVVHWQCHTTNPKVSICSVDSIHLVVFHYTHVCILYNHKRFSPKIFDQSFATIMNKI